MKVLPCHGFSLTAVGGDVSKQPTIPLVGDGSADDVVDGGDCFPGTPMSHIGIVSREYRVPCTMATEMAERPANGTRVEVDCTDAVGVVRSLG